MNIKEIDGVMFLVLFLCQLSLYYIKLGNEKNYVASKILLGIRDYDR